ncbi:hypothetical protein ACS0TY_031178 [Phlomoides rotata]
MATNVEIISREMITPSSPTPTHLKTLKLSFIDQLAPSIHVPLILFYHHHQLSDHLITPTEISRLLKQSLSKILTIFYPLGGIVQENSSVDCNDSGAEFTEARVFARASDVIQEANMEEIKKLLPVESLEHDENIVLKVRLNFFDCGGVAIAVCLSHKIADGTSLVAFIDALAAVCRGGTLVSDPTFDFASFFPPRSLPGLEFTHRAGITEEKIVTKGFVFNKEKLAKLKDGISQQVKNPTRVEAVSSYMWRSFIKAKAGNETASFAAVHAVNLRPRKRPPLSQQAFGNCWRHALALFSLEEDYSELVVKLRASITSMDDDFIKKLENGEYVNDLKRSVDLFTKGGVEFLNFSSWCKFPMYEIDFGWGKPVWVCTTTLPFKNVVVLMSTPCGDGIEAWVNMLEDDMKLFEQLIG